MEFSGQYLTYNEYRVLGGTLDITPFNLLEFEARRKIDERTQNRLKRAIETPQEVKICVFKLIDTLLSYISEKNNNKNIASESVGSYSVSYISGGQIQEIIKFALKMPKQLMQKPKVEKIIYLEKAILKKMI